MPKTRFFGPHFYRQYGPNFNDGDVNGAESAYCGKITQNNGHYAVQSHSNHQFRCQQKVPMKLPMCQ